MEANGKDSRPNYGQGPGQGQGQAAYPQNSRGDAQRIRTQVQQNQPVPMSLQQQPRPVSNGLNQSFVQGGAAPVVMRRIPSAGNPQQQTQQKPVVPQFHNHNGSHMQSVAPAPYPQVQVSTSNGGIGAQIRHGQGQGQNYNQWAPPPMVNANLARIVNTSATSVGSDATGMSKRRHASFQFPHDPMFGSPLDLLDVGKRDGGEDTAAKRDAEIFRLSLQRTAVTVGMAAVFGLGTWLVKGRQSGLEFFAGYLIEQSLSVDNLFVFILLFDYFAVPLEYQSRVLTWGIIGAVVMRGIMIALGVAVVKQFRWVILIFSGILLVSAYKLFQEAEEEHDLHNNMVVKFARKVVGAVEEYDGDRFFTTKGGGVLGVTSGLSSGSGGGGRRVPTPLLLCLVCIELSDFAFAVDSIPAVLGVSHDPFIVYSSNIFAIMALRSLYTIVARAINHLPYLKPAVALVLGFVGIKMMLEFIHINISTGSSLIVVTGLIAGGVILSLLKKGGLINKRKNSDGEKLMRQMGGNSTLDGTSA